MTTAALPYPEGTDETSVFLVTSGHPLPPEYGPGNDLMPEAERLYALRGIRDVEVRKVVRRWADGHAFRIVHEPPQTPLDWADCPAGAYVWAFRVVPDEAP